VEKSTVSEGKCSKSW